jgi:hypothetical protein
MGGSDLVRFRFRAAVLVGDLVLFEEFSHFLGHYISIILNGDERDFFSRLGCFLRRRLVDFFRLFGHNELVYTSRGWGCRLIQRLPATISLGTLVYSLGRSQSNRRPARTTWLVNRGLPPGDCTPCRKSLSTVAVHRAAFSDRIPCRYGPGRCKSTSYRCPASLRLAP